MIIATDIFIPFPRPLVYATYRDHLLQLVPYLHDVRRIQLKSRVEENELVYCTVDWWGGGEIPAIARAFLSEDLLSWTDYSTWSETEYTVEWRSETHAFTEAVCCFGRNHFLEEGTGTRIENRGQLVIDPTRLEGVPRFLSGQVGHVVEDLLGKRIKSNLKQMGEGVRQYLEAMIREGDRAS